MNESEENEERPAKRNKTSEEKCIICLKKGDKKQLVSKTTHASFEKLLSDSKERASYGDQNMKDYFDRMDHIGLETLVEKFKYHTQCYKHVTNKTNKKHAKEKFERKKNKQQTPSTPESVEMSTKLVTSSEKKKLRSSSEPFIKNLCIICQESEGVLHKVQTMRTGQRMLEISKLLQDQSFFRRLHSVPNAADAVANDVQYHLKCWVLAQRSVHKQEIDSTTPEIDDVARILADIEIINIIKYQLRNTADDVVLDMTTLNRKYNDLLGKKDEELNFKRYIKELISENVQEAVFIRPPARNEAERICTNFVQEKAIETYKNKRDDFATILSASKIIREDILKKENWKFQGSLSDFENPQSLDLLLKWIIVGPDENISITDDREQSINNCIRNVGQIILNSTKTKRQVNYKTKSNSGRGFYNTNETPFTVGLALHMHKETRSKKIIDHLYSLNLSISYEKLMTIENEIGNAVMKTIEENDGVYIPPNIIKNKPLHFAIDNTDFKNDTPDGKLEFHGTGMTIFQKKDDEPNVNLKIERLFNTTSFKHKEYYVPITCYKPNLPNEMFPNYRGIISKDIQKLYNNKDREWSLCQTFSDELNLPTWAATNSLLNEILQVTKCQLLPLYRGSPTDWSNLFTALKIVQGINTNVTPNKKTIISFDLQLYAKCMQLRDKKEITDNFVFRLGELHIVFAFLKVIGKYIEGSGLDRLLIEAGIYGPTTLGQIINGKHMKRAVEAYMIIYMVLTILYRKTLEESAMIDSSTFVNIEKVIKEVINDEINKDFKTNYEKITKVLSSEDFISKCSKFDNSLQYQAKFLKNFMKMYEILLLFIRSSRQGLWDLHLQSLDSMVKYFFAHDQLNYARLTPLYLADMENLEESDNESWLYLKDNFSIGKSNIAFTAIGSDHAMEQENKLLKVSGGVTGLTLNHAALERFCLIAPILSEISTQFQDLNDINDNTRKEHYQLSESISSRYKRNVVKLLSMANDFEVSFESNESVYNLVSKAILSEETSQEYLSHEAIGKKMYDEFISERLRGESSVWSKMKKRNLKTFKTQAKGINTKVGDKIIKLKEEKTLLSRFLIAARKRPELELESCIGNFEFSVVPKSLFSVDGEQLLCSDKSKILHHIEGIDPTCSSIIKDQTEEEVDTYTDKVMIIDGMAVVNQIVKTSFMKTCKDFAIEFTKRIEKLTKGFNEVRLVFDKYIRNSLKDRTRRKRTSGNEVRYHISDTTNIENISLKKLLSHIETKQELTCYLSRYSTMALSYKSYAVTYNNITVTNIDGFDNNLLLHDHEEADTLLILHSINVFATNPFRECYVYSPDTDVFLLLIHYAESLPQVMYFRTGNGDNFRDIDIKKCYESIGPEKAKALLGFHTFTGCDQTGRFNGKSKTTWWKAFMKADRSIVYALSKLGENEHLPSLETLDLLEKFVVNLYSGNSFTGGLPELRWYFFTKFQNDTEKLPPTMSALKYKIFRCHFVTLVLKRSHLSMQTLPNPTGYGWEIEADSLAAIMTDNLPAPLALIELSVCGCKSSCSSNRCKCFKNNLVCTDMCKCTSCENDGNADNFEEDESDLHIDTDSDDDL